MGTRFEELTTVDTSAIAVARTAIVPVIFIFCFVYVYDNIALQSESKTKWKSQSKFYWRHQSSATRKKFNKVELLQRSLRPTIYGRKKNNENFKPIK